VPHADPWPDLRHVRYVVLSASPPGSPNSDLPREARMLRNAIVGASALGSVSMHVHVHPITGVLLGGAVGALSGLLRFGRPPSRGFALVPWGIVLEGEEQLSAIRWSGVHALDVRYRATRDGTVRTRVEIDSVRGSFVGWASDAVDFGALAGNLHEVATASSRPIAVDLDGETSAHDGEPFVERVLDAARRLVLAEGEVRLGLEPRSYRHAHGPSSEGSRTARALHAIGISSSGAADPWALIAAIAGELRLSAFLPELSRLSNAPHPGVAALARAAIGRLRRADDETEDDALSWFVEPDELARLRAWRDA
jgi:hypothetical protein